jgi:ABC-type multidrug transport system fused ATPase/permease subunit
MAGLDSFHDDSVKYMAGLIGFAFYSLIPYFFQFYFMTRIEEEITHNLRKRVFNKLMNMPLPWYDRPENEGGQIAAKLGVDVKEASTLVSTYIPILISNFTTCVGGIVICLVYLWQIGLLSLYAIPMIAIGGYISMLFIGGYDD